MKIFPKIIHSVLLVSTLALGAHPLGDKPRLFIQQTSYEPIRIPDLRTLSYDEIIDLLARIESVDFDERYSMEELDQINQFVSFLAMEGANDEEKFETERDIASLFRTDSIQYALLIDSGLGSSLKPAIYIDSPENFILCKSWFKKQCDQTRSFVKKHKKAIIVGAIVAVTVAVVVVTAVAISSAAATAAAAAGGALAPSGDSAPHLADQVPRTVTMHPPRKKSR
jgi:hypothetical protein